MSEYMYSECSAHDVSAQDDKERSSEYNASSVWDLLESSDLLNRWERILHENLFVSTPNIVWTVVSLALWIFAWCFPDRALVAKYGDVICLGTAIGICALSHILLAGCGAMSFVASTAFIDALSYYRAVERVSWGTGDSWLYGKEMGYYSSKKRSMAVAKECMGHSYDICFSYTWERIRGIDTCGVTVWCRIIHILY